METFGSALGAAIEARNLNQTTLARKLGVQRSAVSKWIAGHRTPGIPTVYRLAALLDEPAGPWLRLAGFDEEAERWQAQQQPEVATPLVALRHDVARLPMRPAARGALVKLAEELSRTVDEDCRLRFDEAWRVVTGKYAAGDEWDLPTLLGTLRHELTVEMFEVPSRTAPPR